MLIISITCFCVPQVLLDIFHRLVHLLVTADIQLHNFQAIRTKFFQFLCALCTFVLQGWRDSFSYTNA